LFSPFDQGKTTVSIEAYPAFECEQCNYVWTPRVERPAGCPQCNGKIDYDDSNIEGGYDEIQHEWLSDGENGKLTEMRGGENTDGRGNGVQDVDKGESDTDNEQEGENSSWRKQ